MVDGRFTRPLIVIPRGVLVALPAHFPCYQKTPKGLSGVSSVLTSIQVASDHDHSPAQPQRAVFRVPVAVPPEDRRAGKAVSAQTPPRFPRLLSARLRLLQLSRGGVRYVRARLRGHRRHCYLSALGPAVLRQVPPRPQRSSLALWRQSTQR